MDYSLPGSSVHGISQAGILEWVAMTPPGDRLYPGVQPAGDGLVVTSTPKSAFDGNVDSDTEGPENVISMGLADLYLQEPS